MAKLTPHIMSEDARAQAEFYTHALGGEILSVITHAQHPDAQEEIKDKLMHLSLVAGGITFFMTGCMVEPLSRGNGMNLNREFATETEARAAFDKLAEGGNVRHPLQPEFWGALFGQAEDKYVVLWMITNETNGSQA